MDPTQINSLSNRLSELIDVDDAQVDLSAIAGVIRELRAVLVPKGVLYASRAQAARQRELRELFQDTSNLIRASHRSDDRAELLTEALTKVQSACALATSPIDDEQPVDPSKGELLGNILIVGWW